MRTTARTSRGDGASSCVRRSGSEASRGAGGGWSAQTRCGSLSPGRPIIDPFFLLFSDSLRQVLIDRWIMDIRLWTCSDPLCSTTAAPGAEGAPS
uniref:Predicted protein n=1 Tax=Hordeum vulgare subsp. vulgare TaxID=112509 RepID=F2E814_HORVV|nr:predicted protein [Hordeum vulgare subsp. vulgare]